MHDYRRLKTEFGTRVSQTIDSPITILDFWELSDAFIALSIILTFGVILYSWGLMTIFLAFSLVGVPWIKSRYHRGIFFHWPYKHIWISLPGLINPRGNRKYSD